MWLLFVHLARLEAYWLEGRTDAAVEELDRIGHAFGGVMPVQRVGWHCGHNESLGSLIRLILSRSSHNSQAMVHGPSNSGIGWATAMRPH